MASTKIINVLKDDSFTEILDLFRATPAEEVIFVLPKRSKAFQKESHFETLKDSSRELGKTVSFLCSNPEINDQAKHYGFDVLLPRSSAPTQKSATKVSMVNEIEDFYDNAPKAIAKELPAQDEDELEEETEPEADDFIPEDDNDEEDETENEIPIKAERMADVIRPEPEEKVNVKISSSREKESRVQVHHDFETEALEERAIHEIHGRWQPEAAMAKDEESEEEIREDRGWSNWLQNAQTSKTKDSATKLNFKKPNRGGSGKRYKPLLVALGSASVIVLAFVVYISTGSAKVIITPNSQPLDLQINVTAATTASAVDAVNFTVPGQLFNIQKTVSQNFPATGKQATAQKAHGPITVYNNTSASQALVATTRFQSADGHVFRSITNVVVPAGKTAVVQVAAVAAGSDYDVPAGKFTIPAFQEQGNTEKFQNIYGQTTDVMHGGTSGEATVVAQSDFDSAKATLTDAAKQAAQSELQSETDGLTTIGSPSADANNITSTAQVGDATDTFTMSMTGTVNTVGFKPSDLDQVIQAYVASKNNLGIVPDKLTLTYSNVVFDATANAMHFTVEVKGPGYAQIDQNQLMANLLGKSDSQIKDYLKSVPGVASANVMLSPIWVRSIPKNSQKVTIDINYN